MGQSPRIPPPPRGIKALPFRFPILFYRLGMGWLLGSRFLLLTHRGRISGQPRQTVLEVINSDSSAGWFVVVSGFGSRSQWFQNISADPGVRLSTGGREFEARTEILDPDQAAREIRSYAQKHPRSLKTLSRLLGYQLDLTEESLLAFSQAVPVVRFQATDKIMI